MMTWSQAIQIRWHKLVLLQLEISNFEIALYFVCITLSTSSSPSSLSSSSSFQQVSAIVVWMHNRFLINGWQFFLYFLHLIKIQKKRRFFKLLITIYLWMYILVCGILIFKIFEPEIGVRKINYKIR